MGCDITFIFATRSRIQREEMNGMGNFLKWRDSRERKTYRNYGVDEKYYERDARSQQLTIEETHHRTDLCDCVL